MLIISAEERLREKRGAKALLLGPPGVGKTSQVKMLDPKRTLFIDIEAGDLVLQGHPVPTIRIDDWQTARDVAALIGGPNKSSAPTQCYSEAHFNSLEDGAKLSEYDTIVVDSITALSRLSYRWAEQQPEALTSRGQKDIRGAYGLHAREMLLWLNHLQHAREKNIVFVGVLERHVDELNHAEWRLQCEGQKVPRELPAIVDNVISYQFINFGDGEPAQRGFVCTSPNPWSYPAKDRSGRLDPIEPPDLGKLLTKLTNTERI
jgi:hypothetical protein